VCFSLLFSGQNMVTILQLVQNLMHDDEDKQAPRRMQYVGEQGHMALLGHSLAAYISVLDKDRLRKLTTRILSDTTLWLCRLFRYENGSGYYHEDDREGLVKVCRLVINARYEDYATEGFTVLSSKQPVIYQSAACRPGLGQHLCSQLGLPLSSLCIVPCNTMFGSQHQMVGISFFFLTGHCHTDKLSRLKELCVQYNVWLHVEGVNLAMLVLGNISSTVTAATKCDSMTLTPGPWLGLPSVPAVTLYRHEDPALVSACSDPSGCPLQYLGHDGIVQRIMHASQLVSTHLKFHLAPYSLYSILNTSLKPNSTLYNRISPQLGEQLALHVPASGVDVVELEDEGVCVRFNPLMTAAALGTQESDVAVLVEKLAELVPVLSCTLRFRLDFREEVLQHAALCYIEELSWPGLGAVRYEPRRTDLEEGKRQQEVEKINSELMKKLKELDTDLEFSTGPEFTEEQNCIFIGVAAEDLDVAALVETIVCVGREIEESGKLLENMTEVVRKGILEAQLQLQKANEEKLMEEGVLRQIPLVSSVMNWFSPVQSSIKGRTFDLAAGSLDTTEPVYSLKAQPNKEASSESPSAAARRLPGDILHTFTPLEDYSPTVSITHLKPQHGISQRLAYVSSVLNDQPLHS
uniref:Pyridoxal-dependent decarboxylase domain-containing protein 1 n=1 Tax=Pygocentrus nattereri TaxID=42514 RepID=A0AAR2KIN1_PYGNA